MVSQSDFFELYTSSDLKKEMEKKYAQLEELRIPIEDHIKKRFNENIAKCAKEIKSEQTCLSEVYNILESEVFGYVLENKKYTHQIEAIFKKVEVGAEISCSLSLLLSIKIMLTNVCAAYEQDYKEYKNAIKTNIKQNIDKVGDDVTLMETCAEEIMFTMQMFNRLSALDMA